MPTAFTLTVNPGTAQRVAMAAALALVTDTTRRVLNRATVLTPVDQGRLRAGNQMRVSQSATQAKGEVFNNTAYAEAVHDGTAAHVVVPRTKKALRFVVDGEVVFAKRVTIPARKGRPWLYRALVEIAGAQGYTITKL
jgi:hypothetical protein